MVGLGSNLLRVGEELVGVGRVGAAEDNGGGGHGSGGLSGEVRPWVVDIDAVSLAASCHILRPLPAGVVRVPITHLHKSTKEGSEQCVAC